jgi:pimeloyl-ACP methyl ester carboxylesterase
MKTLHLLCGLIAFLPALLPARTWKSADGRSLEGDYVSATDSTVTLKRKDGKSFTLELTKLSAEDQEFVKTQREATPDKKEEKPAGPAKPVAGPWAEHITGDWKQVEGKGSLQCMFFGDKALDASQKWPLVVYLHGKGNDVLSKAALGFAKACAKPENQKERPCFVLAPQCPDENGWNGATGENVMKTLKDAVKNLPVDTDRIYLIGYSMGAFGTFSFLNQDQKTFAAGIPIAGGIGTEAARNLKKTPLWIFHGEKDDVVKPDMSRAIAKALEKIRAPVKYTEFPGEGHGIGGKIENDPEVHKWLFAQKRK